MLKRVTGTSWQVLDDLQLVLGYVRCVGEFKYAAVRDRVDIGFFPTLEAAAAAVIGNKTRFQLLEVD